MLAAQAAIQARSVSTDAMKNALEQLRRTSASGSVNISYPPYTTARHVLFNPPSAFSFIPASPITSGFFGVPPGTAKTSVTG